MILFLPSVSLCGTDADQIIHAEPYMDEQSYDLEGILISWLIDLRQDAKAIYLTCTNNLVSVFTRILTFPNTNTHSYSTTTVLVVVSTTAVRPNPSRLTYNPSDMYSINLNTIRQDLSAFSKGVSGRVIDVWSLSRGPVRNPENK